MKHTFALILLVSASIPAFAADAVPDASTAEKIAATALKAKLGDYTFTKYTQHLTWAAMQNGDYWLAMPTSQAQSTSDLQQLTGWIVQIDRHNGRVMGVYLQYPSE